MGRGRWKKGESGNPNGRPKDGTSWKAIVERIGNMNGKQAATWFTVQKETAANLKQMPSGVTLRELAVMSAFIKCINDPDSRMLGTLMDREDGKPEQPITGDIGHYLIMDDDEE